MLVQVFGHLFHLHCQDCYLLSWLLLFIRSSCRLQHCCSYDYCLMPNFVDPIGLLCDAIKIVFTSCCQYCCICASRYPNHRVRSNLSDTVVPTKLTKCLRNCDDFLPLQYLRVDVCSVPANLLVSVSMFS